MSNPFGPACPHIQWAHGDQYATFIAPDQPTYDEQLVTRETAAEDQGLKLDGDPHSCPTVGADVYVVRLVPVS